MWGRDFLQGFHTLSEERAGRHKPGTRFRTHGIPGEQEPGLAASAPLHPSCDFSSPVKPVRPCASFAVSAQFRRHSHTYQ